MSPPSAPGSGLATSPMALFGEAMKPLSLNLERTFGGLADAFGLASSRELQQATCGMAAAALARGQAQPEYLGLVAAAMGKGMEGMMARLAAMGRRGESVDSLLGLVRLWARTTDEAMHSEMQSPRALDVSAKLLRATTRSRQQQQRMGAIASEAMNVPTRAELDEAYREIQELKRDLRRLRKSVESVASGQKASDAVAAKRQRPATTFARGTPAKRKNS